MSQQRRDQQTPRSERSATRRRRSRTARWGALAAALIAAVLTATPAWAQRELYWRELTVEARLDKDGVLHVRETHAMVMTGDWNGGERLFRPRMPGTVKVERVTRIDELERETEMKRGDLAEVDHWSQDGNTLRWRSRLPSDPDFDHTELRYRIDYRMSHVLERRGDVYLLDHDFAFPDRVGEIERFELDLKLAPEWQTARGAVLRHSKEHLPPGATHVVTLELQAVGDAAPAKVLEPPPPWLWPTIAASGGIVILWFFAGFWRHEAATGRMAAADPLEDVDEAWLEEHVFSSRPELIGGVWDEKTGAPEVAATIARLVVEGKLATDTERRGWLFKRTVLKLERKVELAEFPSHDRALMRALFFNRRRRVDTDEIRKHYAKKGFKPVTKIQSFIDSAIKRQLPRRSLGQQPRYLQGRWYWLAGLFFALVALLFKPGPLTVSLGEVTELHLGRTTGVVVLALIALGVGSLFFSAKMRSRVVTAGRTLWIIPFFAILLLVLLAWFRFSPTAIADSLVSSLAGALATLAVCVGNALIWMNFARTRLSAAGVARRRDLVLARRWFKRELRRPEPRLKDDWFPYLVGLGLGDDVDRWFRGFGGATAGVSGHHLPSTSSSTSWSGGASTWTGGGGRFGGAGATSAWAVAATAVGGGVSAPSSSGGGGGSSGGGSSGGGGGGGW